ncbi:MAG: hypothetical protein ABSH56_35575 [Bryobacteraceae bacterium]|jgi:rhodanese-related sulfurtransferase
MPLADVGARDLIFDNIDRGAAINIYCRRSGDSIADEFRSRGFENVKAFSAIGFETWAADTCRTEA